jgi:hypothetical protein
MYDYDRVNDLKKCVTVINELLDEKEITIKEENIGLLAKEVLSITYSTGGDCSNSTLRAYAETYLFRMGEVEKYMI